MNKLIRCTSLLTTLVVIMKKMTSSSASRPATDGGAFAFQFSFEHAMKPGIEHAPAAAAAAVATAVVVVPVCSPPPFRGAELHVHACAAAVRETAVTALPSTNAESHRPVGRSGCQSRCLHQYLPHSTCLPQQLHAAPCFAVVEARFCVAIWLTAAVV